MASVPISQTHEIHMLAIMTGDAALMKFVVEDLAVQEQGLQHFEEYDLNLRILCKAAGSLERGGGGVEMGESVSARTHPLRLP